MHKREDVKWAPFNAVMNGENIVQEILNEKSKINKPSLSEEQVEELEKMILEAFYDKNEVVITYYLDGYLKIATGKIEKLDKITKKVTLNNHLELYFANIIQIHEKNT